MLLIAHNGTVCKAVLSHTHAFLHTALWLPELLFKADALPCAPCVPQVAKQHQQQLEEGEAPGWQPERSWHGVLTDSAESSAVDVAAPAPQPQLLNAGSMQQSAACTPGSSSAAKAGPVGRTVEQRRQQQHAGRAPGPAAAGVSPYLQHQQHAAVRPDTLEVEDVKRQQRDRQQQQLAQLQAAQHQKQLQQQQQMQQMHAVRSLSPTRAMDLGAVAALREKAVAESRVLVAAHISQAEEALRVSLHTSFIARQPCCHLPVE